MVCQTMRLAKLLMEAYDPQLCTDPWRVVYINHITKLPKTSRGNTAILVLIYAATHFALFFAVRSLSEEDVVYALLQIFVGAPTQFVTDNFKSFKAYGYRAFCKGVVVDAHYSSPRVLFFVNQTMKMLKHYRRTSSKQPFPRIQNHLR